MLKKDARHGRWKFAHFKNPVYISQNVEFGVVKSPPPKTNTIWFQLCKPCWHPFNASRQHDHLPSMLRIDGPWIILVFCNSARDTWRIFDNPLLIGFVRMKPWWMPSLNIHRDGRRRQNRGFQNARFQWLKHIKRPEIPNGGAIWHSGDPKTKSEQIRANFHF